MESKNNQPALVSYDIVDEKIANSAGRDNQFDRTILCKTFFTEKLVGSFFSCIYGGKLRIHLVFNEETTLFNGEIHALIQASMESAGMNRGSIWVRRSIQSILSHVSGKYTLTRNSEDFYYDSTEYIMRRDAFSKVYDRTILEARPYEEAHIDAYLELLNDAMSFFVPPEDFVGSKTQYLPMFAGLKANNAFEAFWKDGKLAGLYWIAGTEVDTMGVSSDYQRRGFGSIILTRAIERVFLQNPNAAHAVLYAVGWNAKAQNFYRKYGMEICNQHKVPYHVVNPLGD